MEINDKVAFITGGSGGLGSVIALRLAASGANISMSYGQNLVAVKEIETQITSLGRKCCISEMDQRDPESIINSVSRVVSELGAVDILVNNAAWNAEVPFKD